MTDMMSDVVELTLTVPGSMNSPGVPSFPWSPEVIENLGESERRGYVTALRDYRQKWFDSQSKKK